MDFLENIILNFFKLLQKYTYFFDKPVENFKLIRENFLKVQITLEKIKKFKEKSKPKLKSKNSFKNQKQISDSKFKKENDHKTDSYEDKEIINNSNQYLKSEIENQIKNKQVNQKYDEDMIKQIFAKKALGIKSGEIARQLKLDSKKVDSVQRQYLKKHKNTGIISQYKSQVHLRHNEDMIKQIFAKKALGIKSGEIARQLKLDKIKVKSIQSQYLRKHKNTGIISQYKSTEKQSKYNNEFKKFIYEQLLSNNLMDKSISQIKNELIKFKILNKNNKYLSNIDFNNSNRINHFLQSIIKNIKDNQIQKSENSK